MKSGAIIFLVGTIILIIIFVIGKEKKITKDDNEFSDEKWNKMIDMWVDYELEGPINDVLTYDAEVNNGGHLQFFENCSEDLDEMMASLKDILPDDMYDNLKKAYDVYVANNVNIENVDDYVDVALTDLFGEHDSFYYNNSNKVTDILRKYAATLKLDD